MLKSLYISNYALISELNIQFNAGFTVITGETGAGKSIILGALSLILGQRADNKSIKLDADKCIIEAEFDISNYHHLKDFFEENDLDFEISNCSIRRELTNTGKSRAFINDTPVALNLIRDLSGRLLDIHSQHENLLLSNDGYQLDVVDTVAQNAACLQNYKEQFVSWKNLLAEYNQLKKNADKQTADLDYIQFQFQQLSDANLREDEQTELEFEQETLSHAEEIKHELQKVRVLTVEENASLSMLKDSMAALSKIKAFVTDGDVWHERLQSTYIEIKDIVAEISAFEDKVEFNPTRLEWVQNRLSELFVLQKKYKVATVEELIQIRDEFDLQLQRINSFDEDIEDVNAKISEAHTLLVAQSKLLTASRMEVCSQIEQYMVEQLTKLGMPNIQFKVQISALPEFAESGNDEVQFLFSANKNRAIQPVTQIASGGEISRVMLSIKSLIAHKSDLPTIIFDEIDTGVSGEIAHKMGDIMKTMSHDMQVLTITHLPQIASKGNNHYRVFKNDEGEQTQTHIEQLSNDQRVLELAQMLSGKDITDAALNNAKEMMRL